MKNLLRIVSIVLIVLFMQGCASLYTSSDCTPNLDLTKYTTYRVCTEDMKVDNPNYPQYDNQFNRNLMKEVVESEMNKRGYIRNENTAQLQAGFKLVIADEVTSLINCYDESEFNYGGEVCRLENYYYKEETLMVYVSDLKTNEIIWHAVLSKSLTASPSKFKRLLQKKIIRLFKELPSS